MSQYEYNLNDGVPIICKVNEPPSPEFVDCEKKLLEKGDTILVSRKKEKHGWSVTFITRKGNKIMTRLPVNYELEGRIAKVQQIEEKGEKINEIFVLRTTRSPEKMNLPKQFVIRQRRIDKQII